MRRSTLALLPLLSLLVVACSPGAGPGSPSPAASSPASPAASPSPAASAPTATRIEVRLTDALRIEPATMTVPAGVPVTFVVTNVGQVDHEFFLGDEAAQAEHGREMQQMGGMAHDEAMGIGVAPGVTKELTVTFPTPGTILAGCHVAGHYLAGMKATIEIR